MNDNKQIQVTKKGLEELKQELDELVNVKRPALVERLERARQEGDLSENSDYTNAREELEFTDNRIDELKHVVDNAKVIKESNGNAKGKVEVGTTVVLELNGAKHEFKIVGEWEADPMERKISNESPLGSQLVGKKIGEEVQVEAPAGQIVYKILEVK